MADYNMLVGSLFNGAVPDQVSQSIASLDPSYTAPPPNMGMSSVSMPPNQQSQPAATGMPNQQLGGFGGQQGGGYGGQQPWDQMGLGLHPHLANWLSSYMGQQGGQFGGAGNSQMNNLIAPYLGGHMHSFSGLW